MITRKTINAIAVWIAAVAAITLLVWSSGCGNPLTRLAGGARANIGTNAKGLDDDVAAAIERGVTWLANNQESDGSWPEFWEDVATTGLAVLKLEIRAYELGYASPFADDYPYRQKVIDGLNYLFAETWLFTQSLSLQDHTGGASGTVDNPDTNGNGLGVYAHGHTYPFDIYDTGIVLAAIAASGTPDRLVNTPGSAVNGWTYFKVAQDMVDWLAWAQADLANINLGDGQGGWEYQAADNGDGTTHYYGPDNSNTGYAVLGLAYGQEFGCTVPVWVKIELNAYIDQIQDTVDGGSWYNAAHNMGIGKNILKTGNLIFELAFVGDAPDSSRMIKALSYLEAYWGAASGTNQPPGWDGNPANYQAMFCAMKGLEYAGIDTFDGIDWYADFAGAIVAQQDTASGAWLFSSERGNPTIITEWALLVLEKAAPPPPVPRALVDIKPGSCPNPLNTNDHGVVSVAIVGTTNFAVEEVDPASVTLEGVSPLRWSYEDVATPYEGELSGAYSCTEAGPDGYMDLVFKFDAPALVAALGNTVDRETRILRLTGQLSDGSQFYGEDVVIILKKK